VIAAAANDLVDMPVEWQLGIEVNTKQHHGTTNRHLYSSDSHTREYVALLRCTRVRNRTALSCMDSEAFRSRSCMDSEAFRSQGTSERRPTLIQI